MDEVIEAMARGIWEETVKIVPTVLKWEQLSEGLKAPFIEYAAAAYNAMRETLVPRAYHLEYAQTGDTGLSRFAGHAADGWTETPIYALPEIDNG